MRRLKIVRKWKRASVYKKSLIMFTILLCILGGIILGYVYKSMIIYERNLVDNYINYLATSGKISSSIDNNLFEISKYEKKNASIKDGVKKIFKSDKLVTRKNTKLTTDKTYAYDLVLNDKVVSTVSLESKKTYKRMAILTIDEWDVKDIETYFEDGLYSYEINIPKDYKLYINNNEVEDSDISKDGDIEGLDRLTKYVEIRKSKTYEIKNLLY